MSDDARLEIRDRLEVRRREAPNGFNGHPVHRQAYFTDTFTDRL